MIYFDNNATTSVPSAVRDAMANALDAINGNASSSYTYGRQARDIIENSREAVRSLLAAKYTDEIYFTSGGTESDNWAIFGGISARPGLDHIITTSVEHEAVRIPVAKLEGRGYKVTALEVDRQGMLDLDALTDALGRSTALVSVMLANNETGVIFPVEDIGKIVKERSNAVFHVDGVNAVGKVPINLQNSEIDLFSISAHKFHGPKGVGALYIRRGVQLEPLLLGGPQEGGKRAGTEAVHQIAGMAAAADLVRDLGPMEGVRLLRDRLENEILNEIPNSRLNGTPVPSQRLPNTSNISFENTNGESLLAMLDELGVCVSTGSACNSAAHSASGVLSAMGVPYSYIMGSIRFSLGRFNTAQEVDFVTREMPEIVRRVRSTA